ncbi:37S ribosomal protein S19 [Penicillium rolfsii]|nr:37S ribosomal protein S19 [Penicillium rolfsii]
MTSEHHGLDLFNFPDQELQEAAYHHVSHTSPARPLGLESLPLPRTFPPPPNTPPIRTQKRAATILPNFVGLRFAVHNGKTYQEIQITEEMVGRKLGEYVAYVMASRVESQNRRTAELNGWMDRC